MLSHNYSSDVDGILSRSQSSARCSPGRSPGGSSFSGTARAPGGGGGGG